MLIFFLIIIILIIVFICMDIGIQIREFDISNFEKAKNKVKVYLQLYAFRKIKICSIKINLAKIKDSYKNKKYNIDTMKNAIRLIDIKNSLIKKIKIRNFKLGVDIGTGDVILTGYAVAILSTIITFILARHMEGKVEDHYFSIHPIYEEDMKYKINLNCIIILKTVHIIHIIYLIVKKRRDEKHVRTSNRRAYG